MNQATELIAQQYINGAANAKIWADILYNVKAYGAKGDGATDDTLAIQAAINAAIAAGGKAVFFPHGVYKVTALTNLSSVVLFGDNASFSGISNTINQLGAPTSNLAFNPKDYGAKGDGVTNDTTSIAATITLASALGGIVVLMPGTYITDNLTSPSNVTLWFINGAKLSINTSKTVTINGGVEAGLYQIFSGLGTVTLSKVPCVYPQFWGSVGDGVSDDTAAFQAAANTGKKVFVPKSDDGYNIKGSINIVNRGTNFHGDGFVKLIQSSTTGSLFNIAANFVTIDGFFIIGVGVTKPVITLKTSLGSFIEIHIQNIYTESCYGFFKDENHATNLAYFIYIKNVVCAKHKGYGIETYDCWAFYYIDEFAVDRVGEIGTDFNYAGIHIETAEGVSVTRYAHNGSAASSVQTSQHGMHFKNCNFVTIDNAIPDHCGGYGFRFETCINTKLSNSTSVNTNLYGVYATSCIHHQYTNLSLDSYPSAPVNQHGFYFDTCERILITNGIAETFTGDGLNAKDTQGLQINNVRFQANAGRAIVTTGSSAANVFHGCFLVSNTTGFFSLVSAFDYIRDSMLTSGTLTDVNGPSTA